MRSMALDPFEEPSQEQMRLAEFSQSLTTQADGSDNPDAMVPATRPIRIKSCISPPAS